MLGSKIPYPQNTDLRRLVRFSADDGTIWLAEDRMLLLHAAALGGLRKELISSVGLDQARRILTRMGYASGARDAELAKKIRGRDNSMDAFAIGPQLHMLEGSVRVSPIELDMDIVTGKFFGRFRWDNSWEAETHVREFGQQNDPICWMLIGYASGYTTSFLGRFILFRETTCTGCGHDHCEIVGKPVDEWPDAAEHTKYYEADSIVSRLLELRSQVDELRCSLERKNCSANLIGESAAFRRAFSLVERAAQTNVNVLLTGETGVGKERFARALHEMGRRSEAPFVAINCAALPDDLVESELFGVEKGAYTGAHSSRAGKFERADGGTLFLDEIGELPLAAQAKLLRVIQEGELERLGDDRTRKVNVRIIAATNVDLQTAVKTGKFRSDLYYRLNVYPIQIPPLRERSADIGPMAQAMLTRFCTLHSKRLEGFSDKAVQALRRYSWPGNVRELENTVERGVILAPPDGRIELEDLFPTLEATSNTESSISAGGFLETAQAADRQDELSDRILCSGLTLDQVEERVLTEAMTRSGDNMAAAARMLGITRPQLSYRLKKIQEERESRL
jgi:DNA-binding NtrC family response regulator